MEPDANTQRAIDIHRIGEWIRACGLERNRADLLALWNARDYDDLTDAQLGEFSQFMDVAHRCKFRRPAYTERRLRSQVLALLNRLGVYAGPDDWSCVNRFLLQKKVCGRMLYMLDERALDGLVSKLRAILGKVKAQPGPKKPGKRAVPILVIPSGDGTVH